MGNPALPPQHPRWTIGDAILVLIALLLLIPAAAASRSFIVKVINLLRFTGNNPETLSLFLGAFVQALIMIMAVLFLVRRRGSNWKDLGLHGKNLGKNIFAGIGGGFLLGVVVWLFTALVISVFGPPPPQEIEQFLSGLVSGKDLLLPFIAVSILAPLSEEMYFRGMVYPVLRSKMGPVAGMLLSGLFFGAMHLDIFRVVPIGAMGFTLAYLYERTGSLVTPVIAHSAWNTFMLVMMYAAGNFINTG